MFFKAGEEVIISVMDSNEPTYRWITYVRARSSSSPIVYLGTIDTELYRGEVFKGLNDGEVIVVELLDYDNLSDMQNKYLRNRSGDVIKSKARVIVKLEFDLLYSEISDKFFSDLMKNRNDGLDRKLDYRKQRDEVIKENKKLKKEINKFKRFQTKLSEFDWDSLY